MHKWRNTAVSFTCLLFLRYFFKTSAKNKKSTELIFIFFESLIPVMRVLGAKKWFTCSIEVATALSMRLFTIYIKTLLGKLSSKQDSSRSFGCGLAQFEWTLLGPSPRLVVPGLAVFVSSSQSCHHDQQNPYLST